MLQPILSIVRYETLIFWRQRFLLIFGIIGALVSLTLVLRYAYIAQTSNLTLEESTRYLISLQIQVFVLVNLLIPLIVADTFPRDHIHGIRELLGTYPISDYAYVLGKIGAAFLSVLFILLCTLLTLALTWLIVVGAYNIIWLLGVWFITIFASALLQTSLCVILPAIVTRRSHALIIGAVITLVSLVSLAFGLSNQVQLVDYFNISRPLMLKLLLTEADPNFMLSRNFELVHVGHVSFTILAGLAEVIIVFVLMRRAFRFHIR